MNNLSEFKQHILSCYPQEGCGVVINNKFVPIENVHSDPVNFFSFSNKDSFNLLEKEYSVIHSHTQKTFEHDPRIPTLEDMIGQQSCNKQWGIVHCDGENVTDILWFGKPTNLPYEQRSYIANVQDCFTLVRDFIYKEFSVDIGSHPRPYDWEHWNPHYIEQTYASLGFTPTNTLKFGDILLFSIGSKYINHLGIYLQADSFLHHLENRYSSADFLTKWKRCFVKAIRLETQQ